MVATQLTPAQLLEFTADPKTIERLRSLLEFNNLCLALRHTKDRNLALDTLRALLASTDDPVEQRRAAASLLTATRPASPAAPHADNPAETQDQDATQAPRPRLTPRAALTAPQVIDLLQRAMLKDNQREENAGLATIAAFCDDDATINGNRLPTDNPAECIEALEDAHLFLYQSSTQVYAAEQHVGENLATITGVFIRESADAPHFCLRITFTLERRNVSKHPGCWLITEMRSGRYPIIPADHATATPAAGSPTAPNTS